MSRPSRCYVMQSTADRAVALVRVRYGKPAGLGHPVLSIAAAVEANSFHDPECALLPKIVYRGVVCGYVHWRKICL